MFSEKPSQTAMMAAAARAAHLVVDEPPHIFADRLAAPLLGERAGELLGYHRLHGGHLILSGTRAQVTARSRHAEDRLLGSGLTQYVSLGAGLDTFAYRQAGGGIRVFEVDHPATQEWKKRLLADAGISVPEFLTFVGVDFEREDLNSRLGAAGFAFDRPAFVSWLGVSMYLTAEAVSATLTAFAAFAPGSELVMEYALPPEARDALSEEMAGYALPAAAERGEPWLTFHTPESVTALLAGHGLRVVEHVRQPDLPAVAARTAATPVSVDLCRLVLATPA
ncbi:class I SAM-dependent methyltransferase [Nonomuraea wenchangensis]|uniref:S-adenosyl-L-methionine-dependent methyltransferase n=1 Tax=Nonomuraea wenchangensis TaxID=568860 RepID=A0A1I0IXI0_9ACTN|nr:SAM-dependent methyltransferase [Nonomuraea wenchangensis]SEU02051.1 methyltransferase, TIGR00027 family [Nonomuraea wenchangensis]